VKLGGREVMIIASLALHGVIAAAALSAAHEKKVRRATTVSLAEQEKKKPEPRKPPPPPPEQPKPRPRPRPTAAPAPVAPAPATEPAPVRTAPVVTDTVMSNEVGMDMGTGQKPREEIKPGPAPVKPKPAPAKAPTRVEHAEGATTDNAGACTEPPGKPEPTLKTDIEYTEEARAAGIEGRLVLRVTVDATGLVSDVVVVSSVDPALDAAAIATVKTWRFRPALACGKPVAGGQYTIARRFVLGD
jgi:protein TonB